MKPIDGKPSKFPDRDSSGFWNVSVFFVCFFLDFFSGFFLDFLRAQILFLSSIDGVRKRMAQIPLAEFGQKSRFRLAGKFLDHEIR